MKKKAADANAKANELMKAKNYAEAIKNYEEAYTIFDANPRIGKNLAYAYFKGGRLEESLAAIIDVGNSPDCSANDLDFLLKLNCKLIAAGPEQPRAGPEGEVEAAPPLPPLPKLRSSGDGLAAEGRPLDDYSLPVPSAVRPPVVKKPSVAGGESEPAPGYVVPVKPVKPAKEKEKEENAAAPGGGIEPAPGYVVPGKPVKPAKEKEKEESASAPGGESEYTVPPDDDASNKAQASSMMSQAVSAAKDNRSRGQALATAKKAFSLDASNENAFVLGKMLFEAERYDECRPYLRLAAAKETEGTSTTSKMAERIGLATDMIAEADLQTNALGGLKGGKLNYGEAGKLFADSAGIVDAYLGAASMSLQGDKERTATLCRRVIALGNQQAAESGGGPVNDGVRYTVPKPVGDGYSAPNGTPLASAPSTKAGASASSPSSVVAESNGSAALVQTAQRMLSQLGLKEQPRYRNTRVPLAKYTGKTKSAKYAEEIDFDEVGVVGAMTDMMVARLFTGGSDVKSVREWVVKNTGETDPAKVDQFIVESAVRQYSEAEVNVPEHTPREYADELRDKKAHIQSTIENLPQLGEVLSAQGLAVPGGKLPLSAKDFKTPLTDAYLNRTVTYLKTTKERAPYEVKAVGKKMGRGEANAVGSVSSFDTSDMVTNFSGQGWGIFVMDPDGKLYVGNHQRSLFHHSSFLAGSDVAGAGEIQATGGVITGISNKSGHYQPSAIHLVQTLSELAQKGVDLKGITTVKFVGDQGKTAEWKGTGETFLKTFANDQAGFRQWFKDQGFTSDPYAGVQ